MAYYQGLARACFDQRKFADAARAYDRAIARQATAALHEARAEARQASGDLRGALEDFDRADQLRAAARP